MTSIHTCFYEFLCIIKVYSIGIPKSETLSDPGISDKGCQTVCVYGYVYMGMYVCISELKIFLACYEKKYSFHRYDQNVI
jgi:hypothetical protein